MAGNQRIATWDVGIRGLDGKVVYLRDWRRVARRLWLRRRWVRRRAPPFMAEPEEDAAALAIVSVRYRDFNYVVRD